MFQVEKHNVVLILINIIVFVGLAKKRLKAKLDLHSPECEHKRRGPVRSRMENKNTEDDVNSRGKGCNVPLAP